MTPTEEQIAIVDAAKDTEDNLIISALAGAAKTSTLVLIAKALPAISILCLAFNKKIAVEMAERLPGNCTSKTLNSLGHTVWQQTLGKRLTLDTSKTYRIVSTLIKSLPDEYKEEAYVAMADVIKAVDSGKSAGYIPNNHYPHCKRLMDDDEFFNWLDEEPSELVFSLIRKATLKSLEESMSGTIDFGDQLLMPTVFPCVFPRYPLVLIDEAQDLSALNHAMLRKLVLKRLIAVGDECQAIYGFRGAHQDSMNLLQETFKMRKLVLSISFRCPQLVVEEARWRAPHMRFPEWAIPGTVRTVTEWHVTDLTSTSAIICRNNAPLFRCALNLLRAGRYPKLIGNDIGKMLLKIMKKLGESETPRPQVLLAIDKWEEEKLAKSRSKGSVHDQADCLRIFAEAGNNLREAIAYAEHLFASEGPIQLMTGHKSKGLEFQDVFILDRNLIRVEQEQQERNLLYVMQTRAKRSLTYIESEGFIPEG